MSDAHDQPRVSVAFDLASRVTGSERRYSAEIHASWDGPLTPHGGLLQAIVLNAIDAEINPDGFYQPRSVTCHYLRPPQHGAVEVFVDPMRKGRRFATSRATLSQHGKPCIAVLATHSVRGLEQVDSWSVPMPAVTSPPDRSAPSVPPREIAKGADAWLEMPQGTPGFFHHIKLAPRFGTGPFMGPPVDPERGTENGGWVLAPEPRGIDAAWLSFVVDALWPSVLEPLRSPAIAPTLDLTTHFRADLPPGGLPDQPLLLHNRTRALEGGLSDCDAAVFSQDGTLIAQSRQLQLVAPHAG